MRTGSAARGTVARREPQSLPRHVRQRRKRGVEPRGEWAKLRGLESNEVLAKVGMANKLKTHKGARKRLKVSATGKVRYRRSFAGHLMSAKSGNRRRRLRKNAYLGATDARKIRAVI